MKSQLENDLNESIQAKKSVNLDTVITIGESITTALKKGHKLLLAGNGGSAADAQHIAAEFVGRFVKERPSLPAIALTTDTSALTAIGNDYGFEHIFSRQVDGLGEAGDNIILISTSGNSKNVVEAAQLARKKKITIIAFTGPNGGELGQLADHLITIDNSKTARIQEAHIFVGHLICDIVEKRLFPDA